MNGIAVEVFGVPNILPDDRMVDKLTIHFLRPRHGGGEVQRVIFPSYRSGQAFVIFEEPEVAARVLRSTHVLKLEKHYRLDVRLADRPEVDLPVMATLDVSMFPNERAVRQLLKSHDFEVTGSGRGQLRVQGSFLKLRAVKAQLRQLLPQDTQSTQQLQSDPSPPSLNGFNHEHASGAIYKSTGRMYHTNSTSAMPAGSRSPILVGDQAAYALPSSPTSSSSRGSGSPRHLSTPPGYEANAAHRGSEACFITDTVGLHYASCLRQKDIDVILESHNVEMNVKNTPGGSDISSVILKGRGSEMAMEKLQGFLNELSLTLRTQEIPLASLDHHSQVRFKKQALMYKDIFPSVLVSQVGDTYRFVGPSRDSYEMMQTLLGKTVDMPVPAGRTGRAPERVSRDRRSSSLPRSIKTNSTRDVDNGPTVSDSGAAGGYSPDKYQNDPGRGVAAQGGGGPLPSPLTDSRRRRSNSESRGRVREQRVAQKEDREYVAVAPPAVAKSPVMKWMQKLPQLNLSKSTTAEIKDKMTRKSKKK